MENSKYDVNEIKDKLVKVAEDFSKEYTFKPADPSERYITTTIEELKDKGLLSKEVYDDISKRYAIPIQTFEIYVEPPKRESSSDRQ